MNYNEWYQQRAIMIMNGERVTSQWHEGAYTNALEDFLDKKQIFDEDRKIAYDIINSNTKEFNEKYDCKYVIGQIYYDRKNTKIIKEFVINDLVGYNKSEARTEIKKHYPEYIITYEVYEP